MICKYCKKQNHCSIYAEWKQIYYCDNNNDRKYSDRTINKIMNGECELYVD